MKTRCLDKRHHGAETLASEEESSTMLLKIPDFEEGI